MSQHLQNDQVLPALKIPALGGGTLSLPGDLTGSYAVILIYRGRWCPFCNEQIAAFVDAFEALAQAGIKVVAFSVDAEDATRAFVEKHGVPFRMGHSANCHTVVDVTGAYQSQSPAGDPFLESTGFVLAPDATIVNATYSGRAIGRLVPDDVVRLVTFLRSQTLWAITLVRERRCPLLNDANRR